MKPIQLSLAQGLAPILLGVLVACTPQTALAETAQPHFLSRLDLTPMKKLGRDELEVWERQLWPVAKLRDSGSRIGRTTYKNFMNTSHHLSPEKRLVCTRLFQTLADRSEREAELDNCKALSEGFQELGLVREALVKLTTNSSGELPPIVRAYNRLQDEQDSFEAVFGGAGPGLLSGNCMGLANDLDLGPFSELNQLQARYNDEFLRDAISGGALVAVAWRTNGLLELARWCKMAGPEIDEFWVQAHEAGLISMAPEEVRAQEQQARAQAQAQRDADQAQRDVEIARHDAWVLMHSIQTKKCDACEDVTIEFSEYVTQGTKPPSEQFAGATPAAGEVMAAWSGGFLRQSLLMRFPKDADFINSVFPDDPRPAAPLGPYESLKWSNDAATRIRGDGKGGLEGRP